MFSENLDWFDAQDACLAWGGQLVSIGSQEENDNVLFLRESVGCSEAWIGYNDLETEGEFVWSDGSPVTYENWDGDEPNNCTDCCDSPEDVAEMWGPDGEWNDICHLLTNPCFVCERVNTSGSCVNPLETGCCETVADCEDGDPCSTDSCVAGKCEWESVDGCCQNDGDCDDGNGCTADSCEGSVCVNVAAPGC